MTVTNSLRSRDKPEEAKERPRQVNNSLRSRDKPQARWLAAKVSKLSGDSNGITESFYVKIFRGDVPPYNPPTPKVYNPNGTDL